MIFLRISVLTTTGSQRVKLASMKDWEEIKWALWQDITQKYIVSELCVIKGIHLWQAWKTIVQLTLIAGARTNSCHKENNKVFDALMPIMILLHYNACNNQYISTYLDKNFVKNMHSFTGLFWVWFGHEKKSQASKYVHHSSQRSLTNILFTFCFVRNHISTSDWKWTKVFNTK